MTTERRTIADIAQAHSQFPAGITPELFAEMFDQFRVNREHLDSIWHDLLRDHRGKSVVAYGGDKVIIDQDFRGLEALGLSEQERRSACSRIVPKDELW